MKVVYDYPPIFNEIDAKFHVRGKPVIYAWGDIIFNPTRIVISPALIAHEAAHGARQGTDAAGWWRRYLDDDVFRLAEEVVGHAAEYRAMVLNGNRQQKRAALKVVSGKLASPLYGRLVSQKAAAEYIERC